MPSAQLRRLPARYVNILAGIALLGVACLAAPDVEARSALEILRVSPLRIMCFTTPCPPWNAMAISQGAEAPGPHPLYLGPLPSLRGPKPVIRRIAATWRNRGCVIIRGRLEKSGTSVVLFIGRILRSC